MSTNVFTTSVTLLHNPRCSKSRAAKALLDERGVDYREHRYLEEPLDRADLADLQRRLGASPRTWIRSKEAAYAEARLAADASDDQLLDAIAAHPVLLERPILVVGNRAVVGRPPENILAILP